MKILSKIKRLFSSRKAVISVVAVSTVAIAMAVPFVKAEFYPNRTPYDYNKPCNPNDSDKYDRCGSLEGPVFNSFVNTPSYGDERAFFDARRSDQTAGGSFKDVLPNVNEGSKEVVMRMYIHNNANQSTNASGLGVAKNSKVRVDLPSATEQVLRARAYISASNASLVEDTVDLTGTEKFSLSYIPGSATIYSNGGVNGQKLADSVVTTGAPIGHNSLNGDMPGCFEYEAVVQIRVKVKVQETPNLQMTKEVRKDGETTWHKEVQAKPGEKVQWKLATKNISNYNLTNVTLRDVLPPHVNLVSGSVRIIDANQNTVQADGPLFSNNGLITAVNQQSGGIRYVSFHTTVLGDFEECEMRVRNVALARADQIPEFRDDADVVIKKENCVPPVVSFKCEGLAAEQLSRTSYRFTATGSAQNATITGYQFSTNGVTVQDNTSNVYTLNADNPGQYTVAAIVKTNKGNTSATEACTKTINIEEDQPTFSCDALAVQQLSRTSYKFTANGSAQNATINGYQFSLNGNVVQDSASNVYTLDQQTPGNYTVSAIVKTDKGNTSPTDVCTKTVTVEEEEEEPEFACDLLTLSPLGERKVRLSVDASASGGAVIKRYIYNFGDGSAPLTSDNNVVEYQYKKDGTFNSSVQVVVDIKGQEKIVTGNDCVASVTFKPKDCVDNPRTPENECKPCVDNHETPMDECKPTTPEKPGSLPATGPGDIIAAFFSVTVGGIVAYNVVIRRFAGL